MLEGTKQPEAASALKVLLPDLLASFTCDKCGECCSVWDVPVDRDAYDRAVAALGREAARHIEIVDAESHFGYARLRLADGACPFQDGNLCSIHRDFGEEVLFPECRKFPRILYRSPLGLHCTASFACGKTLETLAAGRRVRVLHVMSDALSFPPELCDTHIDEPPCLCRGKGLTWEALFSLEHGFLEILRGNGRSPEHRLLTMIEIVRNLSRVDEAPLDNDAVDRELLAARVDGFGELNSRFLLAASDIDAQIDFILSMLGAQLKAGPRRPWEIIPLDAGFSRWSGLSGRERSRRFIDDYRRFCLPACDDVMRVVENYLVCRVSCNPDFVMRDVQSGLEAVAALLTLVRAVAVALAAAADSPVTSPIMLDAIRAVDTAFFHLPDFADCVKRCGVDSSSLLIVTPA